MYLGNLDALRDWGHAKDYARMQWMMLQQNIPEDFVIATGVQHSVRDFLIWSAKELGITLAFKGAGKDEVAIVTNIDSKEDLAVNIGDEIVRIDPGYYRPTEVETLLGDSTKAREKLGWVPEITAQTICAEMAAADFKEAKKLAKLEKME